MAGLIQKGPFHRGTTVVISELDDVNLMPTGVEHTVETASDLGEFAVDNTTNITSSYVEISTTGYYYNEISGITSNLPVTLSAFVDITRTQEVNINILTTIAAKREKYLIAQGGKTYEEAKIQAQQEVLDVFKLSEDATDVPVVEGIDTFTHMDIGQDGTKNAVLLSLSILLQNFQNRYMLASVSQAINVISADIETDGVCDNTKYIDTVFKDADKIDLSLIRKNLENYFHALSNWFMIPDFESIFENNIIPYTRMTAPIFSRPSGTYNQDISVEIFSSTMGATIYYSINDSEPAVYENPIDISGNGTVLTLTKSQPMAKQQRILFQSMVSAQSILWANWMKLP